MPRLTEAEAYRIAGECLKPLDGEGAPPHRLEQVADKIVAALLGAQKRPAWNTDPPTTEGWRWYRDRFTGTTAVELVECDRPQRGLLRALHVDATSDPDQELTGAPITELKGEWAPMDGPPPREG